MLTFEVFGYETFMAQFIAATLLHMELIREVQQGINMIRYLASEPDKFSKPYVALLVALM